MKLQNKKREILIIITILIIQTMVFIGAGINKSYSIIGGIVFVIYPSTSLPIYPAFHFLSIHSFLFHGAMIYLGILINKTRYIKLEKKDIIYFASLIGGMSIVALIVNKLFDGNLMFISNNFPRNIN